MIKKIFFVLFVFSNLIFATSKEEIANQIKQLLATLPANTISGLFIYNPLIQDTIFALNQQQPMIPASITKLFTTSTSLSVIGGDHELSTKLFSDDFDLSDGIINGNIYIKGYGNSVFSDTELNELVSGLSNKGIKKITGSIVGDDSFLDDVYTREDWIEDERANVKLPPISALVLNRNKKTVRKKIRRRYRDITQNVTDPSIFVASELASKLKLNGIGD